MEQVEKAVAVCITTLAVPSGAAAGLILSLDADYGGTFSFLFIPLEPRVE